MDRRSWPWKKKSHDKAAAEKAAAEKTAAILDSEGASLASAGSQANRDNYKKPKYVQISVDSYTHLTGLEEQVKQFEEQVKKYEEKVKTQDDEIEDLNEKLTAALASVQAEVTAKENLVKQHAKVAEEAVSGWEKAEAEALALKNHLETVTLSKLTAEDRAAHLDGALKECMRQIRNLKEEHEQKLQDVIHTKSKQMEKLKVEFEAKIMELDQELLRSAGENAALSRSLQERSNMLIKVNEEKLQGEADIEMLKSNIESCEREINSLKYELHIASKELEIRTEEKNMSMRSAEVANKQHLEGVKKITKLEAECQRLRGLVRKKLPGPAALAQMKLEVESLGRDYGETRQKMSPVKPPSPRMAQTTDFSLDNVQKFHKENEFLTERLLAMEEETKMLKEALAKRNTELLSSRNMCAQTASRLQSLEAEIQLNNQQTNTQRSNFQIRTEGFLSQNASHPRSLTSMSDDGNNDDRSCTESWGSGIVSELSTLKRENSDKPNKSESHLELMDDFLEMEKLACSTNDPNGTVSTAGVSNNNPSDVEVEDAGEVTVGKELQGKAQLDMDSLINKVSSNVELSAVNPGPYVDHQPLTKLRSRISMVIDSASQDTDMEKILANIKSVVQDSLDTLHHQYVTSGPEPVNGADGACDQQACPEDSGVGAEKKTDFLLNAIQSTEDKHAMSEDMNVAISQIHDFVLFLGKEAVSVCGTSPDGNELNQKIENFSATFNKLLQNTASWDDVILDLSHVLAYASKLRFKVLGYRSTETGSNSPDCIDKVALPENKSVQKDLCGDRYHNCHTHISDPEMPDDGHVDSGYESNTTSSKSSMEEFEQLKSERDHLAIDLASATENLVMTKSQLMETEQLLAEVKSKLASAQKSNSLADTQLKCMTESYRSLEKRADELETEVNFLQAKTESMVNELQEEKRSHQDALARCNDLQEQLHRKESCSVCSVCLAAEVDIKTKKENELAAAAEKLAECQETIFLLGRQLKAMRPPNEMGSPYSERSQKGDVFVEDKEETTRVMNLLDFDQLETDTANSASGRRLSVDCPIDLYNSPYSPSDTESTLRSPLSSKHQPRHRPTKSTSSSSSSAPTPEKHGRGFSRFFSSKGKNGY